MDEATREIVRGRAGDACEYCELSQDDAPFARFHVEHIIARQHGGTDDLANLALVCHHCNFHKGTNLSGIDPVTSAIVPLFNPRNDSRHEHFETRGTIILGRTSRGRATLRVLAMNAVDRVELRVADRSV